MGDGVSEWDDDIACLVMRDRLKGRAGKMSWSAISARGKSGVSIPRLESMKS